MCIDEKYDYDHDKTTPTNCNAKPLIPIDLLLTESLFINENSLTLNIYKLNFPPAFLCRSSIVLTSNIKIKNSLVKNPKAS